MKRLALLICLLMLALTGCRNPFTSSAKKRASLNIHALMRAFATGNKPQVNEAALNILYRNAVDGIVSLTVHECALSPDEQFFAMVIGEGGLHESKLYLFRAPSEKLLLRTLGFKPGFSPMGRMDHMMQSEPYLAFLHLPMAALEAGKPQTELVILPMASFTNPDYKELGIGQKVMHTAEGLITDKPTWKEHTVTWQDQTFDLDPIFEKEVEEKEKALEAAAK